MIARCLLTVFSLVFAFVCASPSTRAQGLFGESRVKASLVAADASVQPGQPVTVALRLLHDPHWHTYWIQPGTGLPTTITWKLPPGWQAGPIQWPAPHVLKDRAKMVIGSGYENELFLPVTLTPPADLAPGSTVTLEATADWLMCEDVCIPGSANVSVTLPIVAEVPTPDATWGAKIRATIAGLPRTEAAWTLTAATTGKRVMLTVTPTAPGGHAPKDLHFFSEDNYVAYDAPQTIKPDGKGGFTLTLTIPPEAEKNTKNLLGVLTSENGWLPDGSLRGLRVDVPMALVAGAEAAAIDASTTTPTPGAGNTMAPTASGGLAGTLFVAFLGGLILNLMPCVFPVLGLKILGFVNQAGHQRSKVVAHGLVFTGGVLLSFWALAGALVALRAGGGQLGWGFQLQSPAFVFSLAVLMLVFALNMSGVFEFGLGATAVGGELQTKSGYAGSLFTGVLATVVATPCSAPFLAPALGAALAVPPAESFAIFTAIAIGLSMPYLVLSIFPSLVKMLPRPGAWMETFKQFMAFPLYATVGYLVWVLFGQVGEDAQLMLIFALTLIALGVWVYGRWNAPGASPARARGGLIAGLALAGIGLALGWPKPAVASTQPGQPAAVVWEAWSPEAVAKLREEGRTVYVDFTARWCATCQTNKKLVFGSDEVLHYFADNKIVALRADWTNADPRITAELATYQRSAIPFNVIWKPGQDTPVILPELLTPGIVLEALKRE